MDVCWSTRKTPVIHLKGDSAACACCIFFQLDANVIKVSGHNKIKVMILCLLKTGILSSLRCGSGLVKVSYHLETTHKQLLHSHKAARLLILMNPEKVLKRNYANKNVKLLSAAWICIKIKFLHWAMGSKKKRGRGGEVASWWFRLHNQI